MENYKGISLVWKITRKYYNNVNLQGNIISMENYKEIL